MKIRFEMKAEFSEKDPHIVIQAAQLTDQAREIMEYLEQFFNDQSGDHSYSNG